MLVKIARNGDALARKIVQREKITHIDLMTRCQNSIPKFLDEGEFEDNPYIVSDFIDMPIEFYLENKS